MARFVTWNVLHRIHALNWGEPCIAMFPDERERVAALTQRVVTMLSDGVDAVLLQEASGDVRLGIEQRLGAGARIVEHAYARVPRLRGGGDGGVAAPTEHLLVVSRHADTVRVTSATFGTDPGKGYLVARIGDLFVVSTHVSHGGRRHAQLAELSTTLSALEGPVVLGGDFNAEAQEVLAGLGATFMLAPLPGGARTRPGRSPDAGRAIDHLLTLRVQPMEAKLKDSGGLSDHLPVEAEVDAA